MTCVLYFQERKAPLATTTQADLAIRELPVLPVDRPSCRTREILETLAGTVRTVLLDLKAIPVRTEPLKSFCCSLRNWYMYKCIYMYMYIVDFITELYM